MALAVVVLVVTRLTDPLVLQRLLVTLAFGAVACAGAVATLVPPETAARALSAFAGSDSSGESTTRAQLWNELLQALPDDVPTLLFGRGTGAFAHLDPAYTYPHNVPLELLYEVGLVGLLLFTAVVVTALARTTALAFARAGSSRVAGLAVALLVFTVVNAQFTGDLAGNEDLWLYAGLATGLVARHRHALAQGRSGRQIQERRRRTPPAQGAPA